MRVPPSGSSVKKVGPTSSSKTVWAPPVSGVHVTTPSVSTEFFGSFAVRSGMKMVWPLLVSAPPPRKFVCSAFGTPMMLTLKCGPDGAPLPASAGREIAAANAAPRIAVVTFRIVNSSSMRLAWRLVIRPDPCLGPAIRNCANYPFGSPGAALKTGGRPSPIYGRPRID